MDLTSPAQARMFSRQTLLIRLTSALPLGCWSGLLVTSFRLNHDLHSEILELVHFTVAPLSSPLQNVKNGKFPDGQICSLLPNVCVYVLSNFLSQFHFPLNRT